VDAVGVNVNVSPSVVMVVILVTIGMLAVSVLTMISVELEIIVCSFGAVQVEATIVSEGGLDVGDSVNVSPKVVRVVTIVPVGITTVSDPITRTVELKTVL
jgi:hypothetical protein